MERKIVRIDNRVRKELSKLPNLVLAKINGILLMLSEYGQLDSTYAKKISKDIFEIRLDFLGQWRVLYAYTPGNTVTVLSVFQKKTQKTPLKEILKAKKRLERLR